MPLSLDEVLKLAGADKYSAPPFLQTGRDGYVFQFDNEPAPQPPGMGRNETGNWTWNGYGLMSDGFSGQWFINPSGIDPQRVPANVEYFLNGVGRRYASGVYYVPDWNQALKDADNGGGLVETLAMAGIGAAVGAAAWNLAGSLTPDGFSLAGAETDEIVVSLSDTGTAPMSEINLDYWSVDPGPDPFATTADVNAGWSFDGGYAGVDWYNNAGIGEAPDIWGSLSNAADAAANVTKKIGGILTLGTAALGNAQRNLTQQQPNYTRAAGGINLGLLAVAVLAWKLL